MSPQTKGVKFSQAIIHSSNKVLVTSLNMDCTKATSKNLMEGSKVCALTSEAIHTGDKRVC